MALITLSDINMAFGSEPLLDGIDLNIEPGERICLLGRNGVGKSTLLHIIGGRIEPDGGEVIRSRGLTMGFLPQEVPEDIQGTVNEVICRHMGPTGERLAQYYRLRARSQNEAGEKHLREMAALHQAIDSEDGWSLQRQIEHVISRMQLPADGEVSAFSAGMKRQVLVAAALARQPDVLLLDEPTNHLDIPAIDRLEANLLKWGGTLMMITHDRMLIRRLATRILEIDRGELLSWQCGYDTYLQRNQDRLDAVEKANRRADKRLSAEEAWIRQGIKARRTRNQGRVRRLKSLREQRRNRRDRTGRVCMGLEEAGRSGKTVVEATDVTFAYEDRPIIHDFSCTIMRGDRIGILGPNGAGKSTLVRLLLGELEPRQGRIKHGTNLDVLYFDQLRTQLDETKTVQQNVCPDGDMIDVGGRRRHVIGYLKDFLFSPQRSRTPVWVLSGGEKNRLMLAKLFTRPANVLVLDEPTNDLDVETLELLEELLLDYQGTILLISHDRAFVNHVVTSTLVFEGEGRVQGYAGGYDDWLLQRPAADPSPAKQRTGAKPSKKAAPLTAKPKKLGYMQQRELDALPDRIEALEIRQQELFATLSDPEFFRGEGAAIATVKKELAGVEAELETAYARWEALESLIE
ncbi:MAG: ABC transporter ATP-binding protein [Deltaproteobacteria bacterium]|nr:MAG: ABC transporter ATP-binding protein [Deltaproteobacteria bacterium]